MVWSTPLWFIQSIDTSLVGLAAKFGPDRLPDKVPLFGAARDVDALGREYSVDSELEFGGVAEHTRSVLVGVRGVESVEEIAVLGDPDASRVAGHGHRHGLAGLNRRWSA